MDGLAVQDKSLNFQIKSWPKPSKVLKHGSVTQAHPEPPGYNCPARPQAAQVASQRSHTGESADTSPSQSVLCLTSLPQQTVVGSATPGH